MHKSKMDNSFEAYWEPNADNHWLRPIGNVGHVWEVNGSGARELSDFHPTRHELITLVKYWAETGVQDAPPQRLPQFEDSSLVIRLGTSGKNLQTLGTRRL